MSKIGTVLLTVISVKMVLYIR